MESKPMTPATRSAKKTGTIEIRLSDDAKAAFMARCRQEERTASEAIRAFIADRIAAGPDNGAQRAPQWRLVVAAAIGAALGVGVAAPSFAGSAQRSRPAFDQLDRNHDGVLTCREYRSL